MLENHCLQNLQMTSSYWISKDRDRLVIQSELDYFVKWVDLSCGLLKTTEFKTLDFETKNVGPTFEIGHRNVVTSKRS